MFYIICIICNKAQLQIHLYSIWGWQMTDFAQGWEVVEPLWSGLASIAVERKSNTPTFTIKHCSQTHSPQYTVKSSKTAKDTKEHDAQTCDTLGKINSSWVDLVFLYSSSKRGKWHTKNCKTWLTMETTRPIGNQETL